MSTTNSCYAYVCGLGKFFRPVTRLGFNKREGKASENAVLTSRVIDRPMRPLFPKDYRNDVTLNNMVMSVDPACRPELVAMLGTAIATSISDIPFDGPCAMTQMGMIDGEFIVNPSQEQWDKGDLKMTVASTAEKVIMIEAGANEIPEARMIEAIYKAHEINQTIIAFINQIVAEVGKPKHAYDQFPLPADESVSVHGRQDVYGLLRSSSARSFSGLTRRSSLSLIRSLRKSASRSMHMKAVRFRKRCSKR